jgi:hypothetical protein
VTFFCFQRKRYQELTLSPEILNAAKPEVANTLKIRLASNSALYQGTDSDEASLNILLNVFNREPTLELVLQDALKGVPNEHRLKPIVRSRVVFPLIAQLKRFPSIWESNHFAISRTKDLVIRAEPVSDHRPLLHSLSD